MRIFEVRNRAYKACIVVAPDQEAALAKCVEVKHMRRGYPRRIKDITEEAVAKDPSVKKILDGDKVEVIACNEGRWEVV